jgi:hypothetical protein
LQEIGPLVDVIFLEEPIGCEGASAEAVGASVGEEDGESVGEEELGVSDHAEAVVGHSVDEEDSVAVGMMRAEGPGLEGDGVGSGDGDVGEIGVEGLGGVANSGDFIFG